MGMEIYEILDIQRYNSNVFNIIEMNMVVKDKYTGIRKSFRCNTDSDLYKLAKVAVPGDTLMSENMVESRITAFIRMMRYIRSKTGRLLANCIRKQRK